MKLEQERRSRIEDDGPALRFSIQLGASHDEPLSITLGKKLAQGMVEVVDRRTKASEDVDKEFASAFVAAKIEGR